MRKGSLILGILATGILSYFSPVRDIARDFVKDFAKFKCAPIIRNYEIKEGDTLKGLLFGEGLKENELERGRGVVFRTNNYYIEDRDPEKILFLYKNKAENLERMTPGTKIDWPDFNRDGHVGVHNNRTDNLVKKSRVYSIRNSL